MKARQPKFRKGTIMKKYQITHANGDVQFTDSKREAEALMRNGDVLHEATGRQYTPIAKANNGYIVSLSRKVKNI
jgi:DUF4097 and DUF4098 domain-containing protein YvlB